jgi:hypothetical protein
LASREKMKSLVKQIHVFMFVKRVGEVNIN